ncbi:MAG TPA: cytochrome C oxidase subunit IV family protein [Thermoplasmata archaeon]|nr:cytochrome C oxidase subunit IV family protein [Thermoplasmata archaeon]
MSETAVATHAAGEGPSEHTTKRPYVVVFAILAVVTLVELNVGVFGLPRNLQIGTLIILATVKACLVVAYYMHLRYEPRWLLLIPLGGLALVTVLVVALVGTAGVVPGGSHP